MVGSYSDATPTSEHNMARFKIATVDGYEITVEHPSETPEDFAAATKDRKTGDGDHPIQCRRERQAWQDSPLHRPHSCDPGGVAALSVR